MGIQYLDQNSGASTSANQQGGQLFNQTLGNNSGNVSVSSAQSPSQPQKPSQNQPVDQSIWDKIGSFIAPAASSISQAIIPHTQAYQDVGAAQNRNQALDQHIIAEIQAAKAAGNTKAVSALTKALAITPGAQPTQEDLATNNQGFQTPGQIAGNFALTGMNALSAGSLDGAGVLPGVLSKAQPALDSTYNGIKGVQGLLAGGAAAERGGLLGGAAKLAGTTANGALIGGSYGAAQGASNGQDAQGIIQSGTKGAETGAALNAGLNVAGGLAQGFRSLLGTVLGAETGAGKAAMNTALTNPTKDFIDSMRGKYTPEQLVGEAQNAISSIRNDVSQKFGDQLAQVADQGYKVDSQNSLQKFANAVKSIGHGTIVGANDVAKGVGVPVVDNTTGTTIAKLVFGNNTPLKPSEQQALADVARSYLTTPGTTDVTGLNELKNVVDNYRYDRTGNSDKMNAILSNAGSSLRNELNSVPGYSETMKPYQDMVDLLNNTKQQLSVSPNTQNVGTAFTKLMTAARNNQDFKQTLLSALSDQSGNNLGDKVLGYQLNQIQPRGIGAAGLGVGSAIGLSTGGIGAIPVIAKAALASSPRVAGETAVKLGQLNQAANSPIGQGISSAARRILTQGASRAAAGVPSQNP